MVEHTLEMQDRSERKSLKDLSSKAHPSERLPPPYDPRTSMDPADEIDLVDLLGFFWRWRLWFAAFAVTGIVLSNILYFALKFQPAAKTLPGTWDIRVEFRPNENATTPGTIAPFVTMLQSPQGTKLFKDLFLSQLPKSLQDPLSQWHTQWLANPGKPQYVEINESGFILHLEAMDTLELSQYKTPLEQGFQNLFDNYSTHVLEPFQNLLDKKTETLRDLGSLSFEVYRDFLNDPQFPQEVKRDFIAGLMRNTSGYLSLDQYTLILSAGSQQTTLIEKKIEKFRSVNQEFENIQSLIAQTIKTYPPTGPLPLEGSLVVAKTEFAPTAVQEKGVSSVLKYNVLGFFLAMMLATFGALVGQFYRTNKSRILEITRV